jgi:hypothetical protein
MKKEEKNNMAVYNAMRSVPQEALKTIGAGRLKGMSDINPMWRIQKMTEVFGLCGIGWKYEIVNQWNENFGNEIKAFCNINLYVKVDGEWSEPIPGTGGSSFVTMERNGAYVNDECLKMALTDALSVAMKALGMAADIYFAKGARLETKYEQPVAQPQQNEKELNEAFMLIKANIESAPSRDYLKTLNNQQPEALRAYAPYKAAMNKRYKEVS